MRHQGLKSVNHLQDMRSSHCTVSRPLSASLQQQQLIMPHSFGKPSFLRLLSLFLSLPVYSPLCCGMEAF